MMAVKKWGFFCNLIFSLYFCTVMNPRRSSSLRLYRRCEVGKGDVTLTYLKASLRFCHFGNSKLPQLEFQSKDIAAVLPRVWYMHSRGCAEGEFCPQRTFGGIIYLRRGYHSARHTGIGCGRPRIADERVRYPRVLFVRQ